MESIIIPLVIGAITAMIGFVSSSNTNDTNVQLTRETNLLNQQINKENNDLQQQLAANANQWSIDQWNRENAYNSPLNQMSRLREAGINPALAYSNGLMNEAASSPAVNMANVDAMRNAVPQISTPKTPDPLTASQIALNTASAKATSDENDRKSELQPFVIDSMKAAIDVSHSLSALNQQSIAESVSRIAVNRESASKLSEEAYSYVLDNKYKLDTMSMRERLVSNQATISDMDVEYFRKNAEQALDQSRALAKSLRASAKASLAKAHLDDTEKQYIQKQVDNYDSVINNLNAETYKLNSERELNEAEADIRRQYGSKEAEQKIKRLRQERISGYVNMVTGAVRDVGVGVGAALKGASSFN